MSEVVCKGKVTYSLGHWERSQSEVDFDQPLASNAKPESEYPDIFNTPLLKAFLKPFVAKDGKEMLENEIVFFRREISPMGGMPSKETISNMRRGHQLDRGALPLHAPIVLEMTLPRTVTLPGLFTDTTYVSGEHVYRVYAHTDVQCEYIDEITPVPNKDVMLQTGMADLIGHDTIHLDSGDLLKLGAALMKVAECDTDKTDVTYKDFMGRNSHWMQDEHDTVGPVKGYSAKNRLALEAFQHEAIPMNYDNVRMQMKEGLKWAINHSDMSDEGKEAAKNLILGDYNVGSFDAGVMLDNASRVLRLVETFKKNDWWTNGLTFYSREIPMHYEARCSTYPRNQEACNRMATDGTVEYYDPF